jgi:hypothetical protein
VQTILFPVRVAWQYLGADLYISMYNSLDRKLDGIDNFCTEYGGMMAVAGGSGAILAGGTFILILKK